MRFVTFYQFPYETKKKKMKKNIEKKKKEVVKIKFDTRLKITAK